MLLLIAAALMFFTGIAHSYLGERYILTRLFKRQGLPQLFGGTAFTTGTLRFAWHLTTVVWWALAYLTVVAAYGDISRNRFLLVLGVMSVVSAAFPLYFTRGKHLSWIVFLLVGVLVLVARGEP
ncbi:MAG: hypothetical protein WBK51_09605 [Polaromonas sp.]